jgi:parallel beta-helix repeat protein
MGNIEGKAIDISGYGLTLSNSEVHHTGGGGVYLSGGDRTKLAPAGNKIVNNHFHHISSTLLTATPAVQISGVGTTVAHNLIEQTANAGIVIYGNNHLVEKNELHHQCLGCADCGAIYASGDWSIRGNTIRNNYVHDVIGYGLESVDIAANRVTFKSPKEGRGIYIDDGASGFEIQGNILSNPGDIGIQINGGRDNNIRGNYISTSNSAIWILNRERYINWATLQTRLAESAYQSPEWRNAYPALAVPMHRPQWPEGNRVSQNIMVSDNPGSDSVFLRYDTPAQFTTISENIIWSTTGVVKVRNELLGDQASRISSWQEWVASGVEKSSLSADPCASISNKSLVLCPASPAKDIKFEPIPNDIGLSAR